MVGGTGCDRPPELAGTSFAAAIIAGIGARVSDRISAFLGQQCPSLTGDPALGLHLGLRLNLSAHAVTGQAFMTCRDLRQVMELFLKYYHLLAPALHIEFEIVDDTCILSTTTADRRPLLEFSW